MQLLTFALAFIAFLVLAGSVGLLVAEIRADEKIDESKPISGTHGGRP